MRIGFCVSGGGRAVEAILEARKVGLLTLDGACALLDKDTSFAETAARYGIPLTVLPRRTGEDKEGYRRRLGQEINRLPVDGLFLTFDWILPPSVVSRFDPNILNLHMALLPLFPGNGAIAAALASGMTFAGATIHRVDEGMDTGPVIGQAITPIAQDMTEAKLGRALFKAAVPICIQSVRWLEQGRLGSASNHRVHVSGADSDTAGFNPKLDIDIAKFAYDFLTSRYPD